MPQVGYSLNYDNCIYYNECRKSKSGWNNMVNFWCHPLPIQLYLQGMIRTEYPLYMYYTKALPLTRGSCLWSENTEPGPLGIYIRYGIKKKKWKNKKHGDYDSKMREMHAHIYRCTMQPELITLHVWMIEDRILMIITFHSVFISFYAFLLLCN